MKFSAELLTSDETGVHVPYPDEQGKQNEFSTNVAASLGLDPFQVEISGFSSGSLKVRRVG